MVQPMRFFDINLFNKKNFIFTLFCLYPCLLISGPFLPDFVGIIFSFYFIYEKYSQKNYQFFKNIYFIIFCSFSIYILLNSIFIGNNFVSIKAALFYFRFGIFTLAVVFILEENQYRLNYFFNSLCLVIIGLFIDGIFQKIYGVNLFGIQMYHSIRVSSFFGEELILGSFLIKLLPITLAFLYFLSIKKKNTILIILIFLSLILILISAEKTAFFMAIIFLLFFLFKLNFKSRYKILSLLIFSTLISLIILFNQPIQKRIIHQLISNSGGGKYIYSAVHDSHYKTAYNMFKDKPLFGHGPKMFRFKCSDARYTVNQFSCSTHPHNYVLQILSETGLIGFIFWLVFYLTIFVIFSKLLFFEKRSSDVSFSLYLMSSSLLIIFLPFAPSGNIFNNWNSCINSLSIGTMLYFLSQKNKT